MNSQINNKHISQTTIHIKDFNVWIKHAHILKNINLNIAGKKITCIIGPSGGGKSTLIRSINRINDDVENIRQEGSIHYDGLSLYDPQTDTAELRSKLGMVFQKPCVFPKSISENVLFGIQQLKKLSKTEKAQIVEDCLKTVSLWQEVSHRLDDKASSLSIGQQQRLCIARTLAVKPEVILLDEPTSSLDPLSTRAIEEMMLKLKEKYTIVFVTHNIPQAKRIADHLAFVCNGELVEEGPAEHIFNRPTNKQTNDYINEEFCSC